MKMIPLTQGRYALCSNEDYNYLTKFKWYYHKIRLSLGASKPATGRRFKTSQLVFMPL